MFEADYLLKSFSVGCEVSSIPPFKQRPCSEGLVAKLPEHLQDIVKPIFKRGQQRYNRSRFWIEADHIEYDSSFENEKIVVKLKKPKMIIRTHLQFIDVDGKIKDSPESANPNSPESKFAEDITNHYDEIAKHFPIFSRLQEIVKLCFLHDTIHDTLDDVINKAQSKDLKVSKDELNKVKINLWNDRVAFIDKRLVQIQEQYESDKSNEWKDNIDKIRSKMFDSLYELCYSDVLTLECKISDVLSYFCYDDSVAEELFDSDLIDYICECTKSSLEDAIKLFGKDWVEQGWSLGEQQSSWMAQYWNDQQACRGYLTKLLAYYKDQVRIARNTPFSCSQAKSSIIRTLINEFAGNKHTIENLVNHWLDPSQQSCSDSDSLLDYDESSTDSDEAYHWNNLHWDKFCHTKDTSHNSGARCDLRNYLCNCIPSEDAIKRALQVECKRNYPLICDMVNNLKRSDTKAKFSSNCNWVPAAFHATNMSYCYGGVVLHPKKVQNSVSIDCNYVSVLVYPKYTSTNQKFCKSKCTYPQIPIQNNHKLTSIKNNNNGALTFQFNTVLSNTSKRNILFARLQLKDRLTNILKWDLPQQNHIQQHNKPQKNAVIMNSTQVHLNVQRTILSSRLKFSQVQSSLMHSKTGKLSSKSSSGDKKCSYSSVRATVVSSSTLAGVNGRKSYDNTDGSIKYKSIKYIPWKSGTWDNSEQDSHMKSSAFTHIQCRGVDYIQITIYGKVMWVSVHPSGYKFNAWIILKQTSDTMKLKVEFQFNVNGMKLVKENDQSE